MVGFNYYEKSGWQHRVVIKFHSQKIIVMDLSLIHKNYKCLSE